MERGRDGRQRDPVLGSPRSRERRLDGPEVELDIGVEHRTTARLAPQPLLLGVALDELDPLFRATGQAQVGKRLVVDREERRRRPELGAHVADRRPVGEGERGQTVAGELDERADHAESPQALRDDEDEVGRGRAARQLTRQPDADDAGHRLVERLAEHRDLGLDAADAVAEDAEGIDHRRVRIGAHQRVRERDPAG